MHNDGKFSLLIFKLQKNYAHSLILPVRNEAFPPHSEPVSPPPANSRIEFSDQRPQEFSGNLIEFAHKFLLSCLCNCSIMSTPPHYSDPSANVF